MPTPVITFMSKVLRNGLRRYIHYTHGPTCENVRMQSVLEPTRRVQILHMPTPVTASVFNVLRPTFVFEKFDKIEKYLFRNHMHIKRSTFQSKVLGFVALVSGSRTDTRMRRVVFHTSFHTNYVHDSHVIFWVP